MKKFLSIIAAVSIVGSSAFSLVACSQKAGDQTTNNPNEDDNLDDDARVELETELETRDLGVIDKGTDAEILAAIQYNNPTLAKGELEVVRIGSTYAQVRPKETSMVYKPTLVGMIVNFQVQAKQLLSNIATNLYLGEIENSNILTIKQALQKVNPELNIDEIEVVEPSIAKESAQVRANFNGIYKGRIVVNYVLLAKELSQDVPNKNLGIIVNNDKSTLSNRLLELNPNLQLHEIEFVEITDHSFIIKGITNGNYYGQNSKVEGTFKLPLNLISDDLKGFNLQLGEINDNTEATIIAALKKSVSALNTKEIVISHITGTSFEIKAKTDGDLYYRLEPPVTINFTLPVKVSLEQISPFKWVNYRTRKEIETEIHNLIKTNTNKTLINLNKDYQIIFANNPLSDEVVSAQKVKVKAIASSAQLTGEFNFEIIKPLALAHNRTSYNVAIRRENKSELAVKEIIKAEIQKEMVKQNINESTDEIIPLLNIVPSTQTKGSTFYAYKHGNENYYRQIVFSFTQNKLFSSDLITWTNVVAPVYESYEINQPTVKQDYSLSYVDSTWDSSYPHAKSQYVNTNHYPDRNSWQFSPTITLASFDVRQMFNFTNINDFFRYYTLSLSYTWFLNNWTSNWGWYYGEGKNSNGAANHTSTKEWYGYYPNLSDGKEFTTNTDPAFLTKALGNDIYAGRKALAGIHIWMEISWTTITIKGQATSAFYWNDASSIHHAAFAIFKGNTLRISKI